MEFYTKDVTKILGIKRPRLEAWLERGYFIPSIQKANGAGIRNIYSFLDIYKLAIFKNLLRIGLKRETAHTIIKDAISDEVIKKSNYLIYDFDDTHLYLMIDLPAIFVEITKKICE